MMDFAILAGLSLAVMAAASTGAVFGPGEWYRDLAKPSWTPPDWLFPVAWMALYIMMTIAAWRVGSGLAGGEGGAVAAAGMAFWAAQITLNAIWSPLFFGIRRPDAAMIAVVGLWTAVVLTTILFALVDAIAGWLLAPYIVWVSYAAALNWRIVKINGADKFGLPSQA
ncbi:MAG: TspO/MBR family protein [Pseudomonadota bacterium]